MKNPGIFDQLLGIDVKHAIAEGERALEEQERRVDACLATSFVVQLGGESGKSRGWGQCLALMGDGPEELRSDIGNKLASKSAAQGLRPSSVFAYHVAELGPDSIKVSQGSASAKLRAATDVALANTIGCRSRSCRSVRWATRTPRPSAWPTAAVGTPGPALATSPRRSLNRGGCREARALLRVPRVPRPRKTASGELRDGLRRKSMRCVWAYASGRLGNLGGRLAGVRRLLRPLGPRAREGGDQDAHHLEEPHGGDQPQDDSGEELPDGDAALPVQLQGKGRGGRAFSQPLASAAVVSLGADLGQLGGERPCLEGSDEGKGGEGPARVDENGREGRLDGREGPMVPGDEEGTIASHAGG